MSATRITVDASDADRRFLLDGTYRSRGSLSLAERSEYGLRAKSTHFRRALNRASTALPPCLRPAENDVEITHRDVRRNFATLSQACAIRNAPRATQLLTAEATKMACAAAIRFVRGDPVTIPPRGMPARFQARVQGGVLVGIVQSGKLVAVRWLKERCHGSLKS